MGSEFQKIPVGILGATGSVGQVFVDLLSRHPWFEIKCLAASEKSAGKKYGEKVNWLPAAPLSKQIGQMTIQPCLPNLPCKVVFSGLDSSVAGEIETAFAEAGYIVISNARNHRFDPEVPLLIPEVNPDHLSLMSAQKFPQGKIVTNPNCATVGLCMALKPLQERFGVQSVHVVTMQAVSGAGYPGVASLDIFDNVLPFISGEEQKLESEPLKILGSYSKEGIKLADISISAHCNRVPVTDGHMECVSVKLKTKCSKEEIIQAWREFSALPQALKLPTAPEHPAYYFEEALFPQPKLHRHLDKGMAVSIGRLRECALFDYKFCLLSHNTIRGAAGCALLNAELMLKQNLI